MSTDFDVFGQNGVEDTTTTHNMIENVKRFREDPINFARTILKYAAGSSWRSYDGYLGQEVYGSGIVESIMNDTMDHPVLRGRIDRLVQIRVEIEQDQGWQLSSVQDQLNRRQVVRSLITSAAQEMLQGMQVTFESKTLLKAACFIVAQFFTHSYHQGVHVNSLEIERIRQKAKELEASNQSLLFLSCHRSHADYVLTKFICYRFGISLPFTVAGDNLNFMLIGSLLRRFGAAFVKRNGVAQNYLYEGVLTSYFETLIERGFNIECFIEGGRSRTGKLLPPKFGMLKIFLDCLLDGRIKDTWILPISTQYDKIAEADSYATELLGKDKASESIWGFLSISKMFSLQLGRIDVRYHEPWSLKEYVTGMLQQEHLSLPLPRSLSPDVHDKILKSLGYRVLGDINNISVVMPTSLVGTILLTLSGRGVSIGGLYDRVSWLIGLIKSVNGRVIEDKITVEALVDNALKVLGSDLVGQIHDKTMLEQIYYPKDTFKLSYYRNQVIHLFVTEAVVSVALYTELKRQHTTNLTMNINSVLKTSQFLSALLQSEFVYSPNGLAKNFQQALALLKDQGVISKVYDDKLELSVVEMNSGCQTFDFYCLLLWPFIDGYWIAATSLFALHGDSELPINSFYKMSQSLAKALYHRGDVHHYEAVNKELLKSAFAQYESRGMLIRPTPTTFALSTDWDPDNTNQLTNLCEQIALARNRPLRYGVTPSLTPQVLSLCRDLSSLSHL